MRKSVDAVLYRHCVDQASMLERKFRVCKADMAGELGAFKNDKAHIDKHNFYVGRRGGSYPTIIYDFKA